MIWHILHVGLDVARWGSNYLLKTLEYNNGGNITGVVYQVRSCSANRLLNTVGNLVYPTGDASC